VDSVAVRAVDADDRLAVRCAATPHLVAADERL
jgi:hypothetical protein